MVWVILRQRDQTNPHHSNICKSEIKQKSEHKNLCQQRYFHNIKPPTILYKKSYFFVSKRWTRVMQGKPFFLD